MRSVWILLLFPAFLGLASGYELHDPTQAYAQEQEREAFPPPIQTAWDNMLQERLEELRTIRANAQDLQTSLSELMLPLTRQMPGIEAEFQQLAAIAQVSRDTPADLNVVAERVRRLRERLDKLSADLNFSVNDINTRLDQLQALETDAPESTGEVMANFHKELVSTRNVITRFQNKIDSAMAPFRKLRDDMDALLSQLHTAMPELWRNYYLSPSHKFFDPASWREDFARLHSISELLALRLSTNFPQRSWEWLAVGIRAGVGMLMLGSLLFLVLRAIRRTTEDLRPGLDRVLRNSGLWLVLGLALHFAAWNNGRLYQLIASMGTVILCWGQMTLAWDLRNFCQPSLQHRLSPLWPMFIPMLVGMSLLFFDPFPQALALIWLLYLALFLWQGNKRTLPADSLSRGIRYTFTAVCWISMILTLLGLARLSILLCMACTALSVCLQQDMALLRMGTMLEERLPQQGAKSLVRRLLMALLIPALLVLATMTPLIWVLAYPGGFYLLRHIAGLGFSVGEVSLTAVQVLSIFIAFYLTRSLISLGSTFLTGLRGQGVELAPALHGPLRTTFVYALWALFGLYTLKSLGLSLTGLTVVAGGLSVGVGIGMQNIVQNFVSGLMVIFGQVIKEGDTVDVAGISGSVRKINIRSTEIETADNATVFIPNANFLSTTFTNWTYNNRMVRKDITVGVAYGSDLALCIRLLGEIAEQNPRVLTSPAPAVHFTDFAASSLNLLLRVWIPNLDDGLAVQTALRLRINEVFAEHGIEISFPQLDVHMRASNG